MRITLIAFAVVAVSSLVALAYAYFTARRGYEDDTGFHDGVQMPVGKLPSIRWLRVIPAKGKSERAA